MPSSNPRYRKYSARVNIRNRWLLRARAGDLHCAICGGLIDPRLDWYTDPADGKRKRHPYSLEVDEIKPVSKGGDPADFANTQPVHRICNQKRGNRPMPGHEPKRKGVVTTRDWFDL